jgi:hypothetical protein
MPRLAASDEHRHPSIESFRDLRIALNALDLRRSRRKLDGDVPAAIDRVLAGVSDHYTRCAEASQRQSASPALLSTIDDAMHRVATRGLAQEAASAAGTAADGTGGPTPRARVSQRWLRDTLHALVGLRLALYPAQAGQRPHGGATEAGA